MITKRIEQFFINNTVWIFGTVILLVSIIMVKEQAFQQKWSAYLFYIVWISSLFSPVLLFAAFRSRLKERLPKTYFWTLWSFCFLLYPFLLVSISQLFFRNLLFIPDLTAFSGNINVDYILSMGGLLFLSEIAIQFNNYWQKVNGISKWLGKINLEKTILLSMLIFSMLVIIASNDFQSIFMERSLSVSIPTFISYTIQIFIISLSYYFYYYINHYLLIPKLLKQKGIIYYGFGVAGTILLFYPIFGQIISWLPIVNILKLFPWENQSVFQTDSFALLAFIVMMLTVPFILVLQWFKQSSEIALLAKEKSANELNFLKQQINPHFFFNTLNNLYALSLKKDEATPEIILQLSALMRYVIYRGKEETVTLAEEVKHIEDYIDLQRLRLHKQLDFTFEKNMLDSKLRIPPLLFIILVENAFKHGIEPAERGSFLHICLSSDAQSLQFVCENSIEESIRKEPGVGLNNLERRLALRFPGQHEFKIEKAAHAFKATLKLTLI